MTTDPLTPADGIAPGTMIRIAKCLRFQKRVEPVIVEGRLLERRHVRTASAFAGAPEGRTWVDEVVVEKPGGERSVVLLDRYTTVDVIADAPEASRE